MASAGRKPGAGHRNLIPGSWIHAAGVHPRAQRNTTSVQVRGWRWLPANELGTDPSKLAERWPQFGQPCKRVVAGVGAVPVR